MKYKLIGKKIKKARTEKELTQEKFAEELDVSVSYISQVESGKKKFNLERIVEISKILEKPIDYFIKGYEAKSNDTISEIINILEKMSNTKLKLVFELIKNIYDFEEL